jgi:hypothetical protein
VAAVNAAVVGLRTAAEGLIAAGRVEGIEPEGPLGQWLEAQAEALRALAEILGGQELRFEELMRNVSAAARAELGKLAAATELGNNVVRAGEVALRQARTAQISLQVEKENLTAMMVKETLPLFVERLKEALIIRERRWNDDVKRRRLATAGLVVLGLVFGGYGVHVWQAWNATSAFDWCWAHALPSSGRVYCDMTGFGIAAQ